MKISLASSMIIALLGATFQLAHAETGAPDSVESAQQAGPLVLKDTRVQKMYTMEVTYDGACHMPVDPDHPEKGDCSVTRKQVPIGGELLTWNNGVCNRDSYSLIDERKIEVQPYPMELPTVNVQHQTYPCDMLGTSRVTG